MRVATNLSFLIIISFLLSCNSSEVVPREYPFVFFDEVSGINEKGVELSGQVLSQGSTPINEIGFVLSLHPSPTTDDRKILSGIQENNNDRFNISLENDLYTDTLYYVRAFAVSGSLTIYSNERSFKSLGSNPPKIDQIYPVRCISGGIITIIGDYFSEQPAHNIVTFQLSKARSVKAQVIKASSDTILVRCPDLPHDFLNKPIEVSIEVALQKVWAPTPIEVFSPWKKLVDFPGDAKFRMSYFTLGSKGYVTLGMKSYDAYAFAFRNLWEYNMENSQWRTLAPFPAEERSGAIGIGIGDYGYIGLGTTHEKQIGENEYQLKELKDLWRFDPSVNTWTRLADFPGNFQWMPYEYFTANGKFYLYNTVLEQFWVYDPEPNMWFKLKATEPIQRGAHFTPFSINNKVYLIEAKGDYGRTKLIWEFNPLNNVFELIDSIPENKGIWGGFSFNLSSKLFFWDQKSGGYLEYDMNSKKIFYFNQTPLTEYAFKFTTSDKIILKRAEDNRMLEFKIK